MKIIVDAQLPPGLVSFLAQARHEAHHVIEIGLRDAPDRAVWDRAVGEGAVIFTKDGDFAMRRRREQAGLTVVWLRIDNCSRATPQRWLMPLLPEIARMVAAGEVLIEVR